MIFWLLITAFMAGSFLYAVLPDAVLNSAGWNIGQFLGVVLALIAFVSVGYRDTLKKIAILMLVLWQGWIFLTDWLPGFDAWFAAVEAVLFVTWFLWVCHVVSSRQKG